MCKPYPYGRCASDARKRLSEAHAANKAAEQAFLEDSSEKNLTAYEEARANLVQAQISFDGTDTGRRLAEARVRTPSPRQAEAMRLLVSAGALRDELTRKGDALSSRFPIPEGDKDAQRAYNDCAKAIMNFQESTEAAKADPTLEHVYKRRADAASADITKHMASLRDKGTAAKPTPSPAPAKPSPMVPRPPAARDESVVAQQRLQEARATIAKSREAVDVANDDETKTQAQESLDAAQKDYRSALVAYVATPKGEAELQATIRTNKAEGKPFRSQQMLLEQARASRKSQGSSGGGSSNFAQFKGVNGTSIKTHVPEISGTTAVMQPHSMKVAEEKGFSADTIKKTLESPERVYPSKSHPGQWRVTGNGLCLVGEPDGDKFRVITMYEDGVITAPRSDQLEGEKGRIYAERYAAGQGRGGGQGSVA